MRDGEVMSVKMEGVIAVLAITLRVSLPGSDSSWTTTGGRVGASLLVVMLDRWSFCPYVTPQSFDAMALMYVVIFILLLMNFIMCCIGQVVEVWSCD